MELVPANRYSGERLYVSKEKYGERIDQCRQYHFPLMMGKFEEGGPIQHYSQAEIPFSEKHVNRDVQVQLT
ncbi:Hypothetical predicted protein [Octopus vulgaris]|uniref:Uncharacterized protein n=1 Tax=Octopus vulgaris TaxID=6645 RepID=A0AA36ARW7_OCTVU|nr:Hypothetical predicted protein [Octopus vulgaris]